jgi:hypothetical protein
MNDRELNQREPTPSELAQSPEISASIARLNLTVSPKANVQITINQLPTDADVANNSAHLVQLGNHKKYSVWAIVHAVGFIISTFVAITRLPEAVSTARLYAVDTYESARIVFSQKVKPPTPFHWYADHDKRDYIVADMAWLQDADTYNHTIDHIREESESWSSSSSSSSSSFPSSSSLPGDGPSISLLPLPSELTKELAQSSTTIMIPLSGLSHIQIVIQTDA